MFSENQHKSILILSAVGWLVAVAAALLALFVGKPFAYRAGYEQGARAQSEANIKAVDDLISQKTVEGERVAVFGRVSAVEENALVLTVENAYLANPLRGEAATQRILVDAGTTVEKQTFFEPERYQQVLEDAQERGIKTENLQLFDVEPLTLSDLLIGQDVRVIPRDTQQALKKEFIADEVTVVIFNQTSSQN